MHTNIVTENMSRADINTATNMATGQRCIQIYKATNVATEKMPKVETRTPTNMATEQR